MAFWVGPSAFEYFNVPFNKSTRWWLDDFLHTRMMYTALHASGQSKKYVVQDLSLPYSTAVYPLSGSARYTRARSQLCIHFRNKEQQMEKNKSSCLTLAYGDMDLLHPVTSSKPTRILNASFEKVKIDLEAEKRAGNPSFEEALGSTWPVSGLYGLKKAIESGAYLQARDWAWKSIGETSPFNMKR